MPVPEPGARPVRVLHVITRMILGGAQENTLFTVIGQQRTPGMEVTLLTGVGDGKEGDLHEQALAAGVNLVVMPSLVRPIRPGTDARALWELYRFMRKGRYDIVHTHSSKAGILGRMAARMARVPIVVHTLHSLVFHEYQKAWQNQAYIRMKKICAPLTDVLISVNDKTAQGALAVGVGRPEQHVTVFSGMELDGFLSVRDHMTAAEAKQSVGIPPDAPVVGKIARLFPLKGHEQFFDAAAHIAKARPDAWFLLVGNGELRAELEARARVLGIAERTVFAGLVRPEDVPRHIHAMDVVVHTSLREGIARVIPQAGAVGKPVVTFEIDGAPEVIRDGVSGYLVPPLAADALARRVVELLDDPARRDAFGAEARAFVAAHFGVDLMVDRINEIYFRLLRERMPALARAVGVAS